MSSESPSVQSETQYVYLGPSEVPLPPSPVRQPSANKHIPQFVNTMFKEKSPVRQPSANKFTPQFVNTVVRAKSQIKISKPEVPRDTRLGYTPKERQNFIDKVITGRSTKLTMIDYGKMMDTSTTNDDVFAVNETIENFIDEAKDHFIRYDIIEFMRKFPWLDESGTVEDSERFHEQKTIDLFQHWDQIGRDKKISLKRIADTTVWMKQYLSEGTISESFLDDLDWQHKYLIECMDSKLKESVLGELKNEFEEESQGGPLTFAVMIERCINLSHDAIDALRTDFSSFTLTSIPGENVEIACRRLLYALKRLENNGALPHDALKILFKIFKTCTVPDFLTYIKHWETSLNFVRSHEQPTYREFLAGVKEKYTNMCIKNEWTGVKEQGSVFAAGGKKSSDDPSNIWHNPTEADKVSSDPVRYQRVIKGTTMKFCEKCYRRGTREKGRWNTTHFTDGHRQGQPKSNSAQVANVAKNPEPEADPVPEASPTPSAKKRAAIKTFVAAIMGEDSE